jgi:predicted nucleic acid-binding protein
MIKTTLLFLCCLLLLSGGTVSTKPERKLPLPLITLVYLKGGTPFDRGCEEFLHEAADKEAMDEVVNRLQVFQKLWDTEGTTYVGIVLEEVGVPFPYREMQATLTVCKMASVSSPLIINLRRFLSTSQERLPDWALSEIVFHEVMHTYVRPVYETSELLKKYAHEPIVVRNHLHEMAHEVLVLTRTDKKDILEWLDDRYRNKFPPSYRRAWEIVNDIEGYAAFVEELKSMPDVGRERNEMVSDQRK